MSYEPKGVEVSNRAAMKTVEHINDRFEFASSDSVLAVTSLDFALSVYDIFGLLSAGGTLILTNEHQRRDATAWLDLAERHGATVWNSGPAAMEMLLAATGARPPPPTLRPAEAGSGRCRLMVLGGATEAGIWSNGIEIDQVSPHWSSIPYGFPLPNQRHRVVDHRGQDRPDRVPGELWIGGLGLADGYRNDLRALRAALEGYVRERDRTLDPRYQATLVATQLDVRDERRALLRVIAEDRELTNRFFAVFAGTASLEDLYTSTVIGRANLR